MPYLLYDRIHKPLHNFQLIFLIIANHHIDDMLHGLNEVFESHLILVDLVPHDLNEDKMVVVLGHLLARHPCEVSQLAKLTSSEDPFRTDTALTVKYFQHVLHHIHFLYLLGLQIQNLLVTIVVLTNRHLLLLLVRTTHQKHRVLNHHPLHVLVYRTHLLLHVRLARLRVYRRSLVLDVQRRIVVRFQQPRIAFIVYEDVDPQHVEALTVLFGKCGVVIVF